MKIKTEDSGSNELAVFYKNFYLTYMLLISAIHST